MVLSEGLHPQQPLVSIFDKQPASWEAIQGVIEPLTEQAFHIKPADPLLGQTDGVITYNSIQEAFMASDSVVALMTNGQTGAVMGYSLAMPMRKMDPSLSEEAAQAAYLYFSVLTPENRGQRHIITLTDKLLRKLMEDGYEQVVRDAMIADGYAAKLTNAYAEASYVTFFDHEFWPEIGPERRFTINIKDYLDSKKS